MSRRPGRWALACLAATVLVSACSSPLKGSPPPPAVPGPRVIIQTATRPLEVAVELARTDEERAQGLMFRQYLGPNQGMLFVFPFEEQQVFWMKNTLISLDMIFIDGRGSIVGIVERAEPQTETPRGVGVPSRYVLEVAGGWAEEHGVRVGNQVDLQGVGPASP